MRQLAGTIVQSSMGNFMSPPGHPNHWLSLELWRPDSSVPEASMPLDSALDSPKVTDATKAQIRDLLRRAQLVESELWLRRVYGYFGHCYSPDGVDRDVNNAIICPAWSVRNPEHHLAYLTVRHFFPHHEPRMDLIAADGAALYATRPCVKCGRTLEYEACVDAFAEGVTAIRTCPRGGLHEAKPMPDEMPWDQA